MEWIEIVPALPQEEAERRFEEWNRNRHVAPDQVRRDRINLGPGKGCILRILVPAGK